MVQNRLVALVTLAIAVAFAIGTGERCLAAPGEADAAAGKRPALHDAAAATASVMAEPVTRASHFVYRLLRPETPSGETIVLLHGSGGDEASMLKLAARVAPDAILLGVRGRVVQKRIKRWYMRVSPTEFDQADIRTEARAFVDFLKQRMEAEKLDLERTTFIGYSNGANLIAAMALLHPDLIRRAVLLRAMPVLDQAPAADLRGSRFLSVAGETDRIYARFAPDLEALLRARGATVDSRLVASGHLLGDADARLVGDWLSAADALAGAVPQ